MDKLKFLTILKDLKSINYNKKIKLISDFKCVIKIEALIKKKILNRE